MNATYYLEYISNIIHRTIAATIDKEGLPVTCAVDMMDADENGLYFMTARGKNFYQRLKDSGYMALTAMKGEDTMTSVAVSVRGKVKELGSDKIPYLFDKNSYMKEIYPTEQSRQVLTVFQLYEGSGEWFDLSKKPIERASFAFGNAKEKAHSGYLIDENCIGCGGCLEICPQQCIELNSVPAVIVQENCLHCGNCLNACPVGAVKRI